jgi:threonine dehydrogenase-like Zn-dependent dehydrogenase
MPVVVRFEAPRRVAVAQVPRAALAPGQVRIRTLYSGISAGTELTAYRGTNPYLLSEWDDSMRLFHPRGGGDDAIGYPLEGWGYSEVGQVVEVASDGLTSTPRVGDVVFGIWGHRSEGILDARVAAAQVLPPDTPHEVGCFARVGSVALNAVLAAQCGIGSTVAVLGQGVIGLLATAFAVRSGARVIAVDDVRTRRSQAAAYGAHETLAPTDGVADQVRELTAGRGADAVIELSGTYTALHEATRIAGPDGRVVAAGFYQGPATALRLGEEFHHNRVSIVASQIGSVPQHLHARWTRERLVEAVMTELVARRPDVLSLVTHRFDATDVADAFAMLDTDPSAALQVLLQFPSNADDGPTSVAAAS